MIEPVSFDPRVVLSSRKAHKCVTCGYVMPKGTVYVAYPCKDNLGFRTLHLCVECTYLMNFKTGERRQEITTGEFTERRIPNFLRKKRAEFRKNPTQAIRDSKLTEIRSSSEVKPPSRIVVKASEFERRIHTIPAGKFNCSHFPAGGEVFICAGVSGDKRAARIKGAWEVDGAGFGLKGKRIAILLEAQGK